MSGWQLDLGHGGVTWLWRAIKRLLGTVLILAAFYWAWLFPVAREALMLGLLAYLLVLAFRPSAWLVVVPAALPVLELTYWSGRVFYNEYDILLLATLGVGLWRSGGGLSALRGPLLWVAWLLTLYSGFVTWRGLFPLEIAGLGPTVDYLSSSNALREGKGFFWALLLLPLLGLEWQDRTRATRLFSAGMLLGLFLACTTILWERALFTGIFNLGSSYRVSGWFFGLHTGGAAIDAYLAASAAFIGALVLLWRSWAVRTLVVPFALLALYCLYVTYSRTNYPVVLGMGLVFAGGACLVLPRVRKGGWRYVLGLGLVGLLAVTVLGPLLLGQTVQARFATITEDLEERMTHWRRVASLVAVAPDGLVLGLGRGVFPRAYYWKSLLQDQFLAVSLVGEEDGETFIRFSKSDSHGSLFLRQRFDPGTVLDPRLSIRLRAPLEGQERLLVEFCERHMLKYQAECRWVGIDVGGKKAGWETYDVPLRDLSSLGLRGIGPLFLGIVPVDIAVMNRGIREGLDIASVQIVGRDGKTALRNPGFTQGMDHWFVSYGNHLRWRVKNLPLFIHVEGGLVGLLVLACVGLVVLYRLGGAILGRDTFAVPLATALTGLALVGLFDSVLDDPRIAFLSYLLVWLALLSPKAAGPPLNDGQEARTALP